MAAAKHAIETTYINSWAEVGIELVVSVGIAQSLKELGLDLLDVNYVLKTGRVVRSGMLETRGLWAVRGRTTEEIPLEVTIAVVSSSLEVELLRIMKIRRS